MRIYCIYTYTVGLKNLAAQIEMRVKRKASNAKNWICIETGVAWLINFQVSAILTCHFHNTLLA